MNDIKLVASSHFELRWKIVSDGYKMFLETDKLSWPDEGEDCCSKKEWKTEMLDPTTWGDEVVLALASNLLELDIKIIPAFREAGLDPVTGVTTIKPLVCARHQAIHLFQFSESDIISRTDDDFEMTGMSIPPAFELTDEISNMTDEISNMTEEDIRNCQFLMTEESIQDIQVVVTINTDHPR